MLDEFYVLETSIYKLRLQAKIEQCLHDPLTDKSSLILQMYYIMKYQMS